MLKLALLIAASLILLGLAGYAVRLLWLLRQQNSAQTKASAQQQAQEQAQVQAYNRKLWDSIEIITQAAQQEQCCLSEAAIRLCVLLEQLNLSPDVDLKAKFPALYGLYQGIRHHPTHEARKQASKQEIRQLDKERLALEQEFEAAIHKELQALDSGNELLSR